MKRATVTVSCTALIITLSLACSENEGPVEVAHPPGPWVAKAGGAGFDVGYDVEVQGSGDIAVTGMFSGEASFGGVELTGHGGGDIFVCSYDRGGGIVWAQGAGGNAWEEGLSVASDAAGDVYVTGLFSGSATFGDNVLVSAGGEDAFVALYDRTGALQWVQSIQGPDFDVGLGIDVDGSGNAVVTGFFHGTAGCGDSSITSAGESDIFVAKYSPSGHLLRATAEGGGDIDAGRDTAVDGSGNIVVTGEMAGEAVFDTTTITRTYGPDTFIAKYDEIGNLLWVRASQRNSLNFHESRGRGIATDASGNVAVTGTFVGDMIFGTTTITSSAGGTQESAFVAKFDPEGRLLWATAAGGNHYGMGWDVATDGPGNVFVTGEFAGSLTFGTITITSAGGTDGFVAKYDHLGNALWATGIGGTGGDVSQGIASDETGSIAATGRFAATATFGGTEITSVGGDDVFVVKTGNSGFE